MLFDEIRAHPVPKHVAIILDGNRRWARERGLPPWAGHEEGAKKVEKALRWIRQIGIKYVTLYTLSTENLRRSREELQKLFEIFERQALRLLNDKEILREGVRFQFIGRTHLLPERLQQLMCEIEKRTQSGKNLTVTIAIAYGGRAEIVDAVRRIAERVKHGELSPEQIDEVVIAKNLYTRDIPDPDLIIRTSGEERISNFLLWQCAYSEFVFLDVYWPEFRKIDLLRAIRTYQLRHRRFGR